MYNYFYEKHDKIIDSQKEVIESYKHEIESYKSAIDSLIHSSELQLRETNKYKSSLEEQVKSSAHFKQKCKYLLDYIKIEKYKHVKYEFSGKMIIDIKKLQSITKFNKLPLICENCYIMENSENKYDFLSNIPCGIVDCRLTIPHDINHVLCKNCY